MEATFKILFTLGGFYTHWSLFNHTTFRPIKSGATVPLSYWIRYHTDPVLTFETETIIYILNY
jgi:hypothetical protein